METSPKYICFYRSSLNVSRNNIAIGGLVETGTKQVTLEYENNKVSFFTNINGKDTMLSKEENGDFFRADPVEDPNSSVPTEFRPTNEKNASE